MTSENSKFLYPISKRPKSPYIISLGSSLNLKLVLSLEENQYESLRINFKEINKTEDLKKLYPSPLPNISPIQLQKLTSLIELHSDNFLFNSLLFLNQCSSKKIPIKYLIPFSPKFPNELNFIYNIIKSITEVNQIYIEDANLLDIKPKITFNLKLIKNDVIIEEKSFTVCDENHFGSKNKDNTEENNKNNEINVYNFYDGDLFKGLNFNFQCDYFYSSIKELFYCKKDQTNEVINFIQKIRTKLPRMKVCINFEEDFDVNLLNNDFDFITNLAQFTDIFFFEKKNVIEFYNNIFNKQEKSLPEINNNSSGDKILENFFIYKITQNKEKQNPLMKLGIFLNNLEEITIIEQNPKTNLVVNNVIKKINIIPQTIKDDDIKEYSQIIKSKYGAIKSVYIGSFLNHLFKLEKQDNFNLSLKTANKCTIRYVEILKFGLDVPSVQKYYEIKIARPSRKKINKEEIKNKQLESRFILDCTNLNNNKINSYNSILDENCRNFFNSKITLRHLAKQGFINKKGLVIDPEKKNEILGFVQNSNSNGKNKLIKKIKTLNIINMNNSKQNSEYYDRIKKLTCVNQMSYKNLFKKDFDSFNENNKFVNNSRQFHSNHKVILPKIKNRTNQSFGKNEEIKKDFYIYKKKNFF